MTTPEAIAKAVFDEIPGCQVERMKITGNTVISGCYQGWGITLHRARLVVGLSPVTLDETGIRQAATRHVAKQTERRLLAVSLGLDADRQPDIGEMGHVVTDRLTPVLHRNATDAARRMVERIHGSTYGGLVRGVNHHGYVLIEAGNLPNDTDHGDLRPRMLIRKTMRWGWTDGRTVVVEAMLPDTVILGMRGRRVGEVVDLHSCRHAASRTLENRIITDCFQKDGHVHMTTISDWAMFEERGTIQ